MSSVTVLLATYNSAPYVEELISSILAQTHKDLRLAVYDDLSADDTVARVRAFSDPRVKLVTADTQSGGAAHNFFRALLGETDDYLMFADADDVWLPDKVEKTLARMQAMEQTYGKDIPLLVHTDLAVVDAHLKVIHPSLFTYERLSPRRKSLKNLLVQNNVTGCTVMINRALRSMVETEPASTVMHDWWLALIAAAFGHIGVVEEATMLYRQHGDNEVGAYNASDPIAAAKKLARVQRTKAIYRSMFAQAGCFADTFEDRLSAEQLKLCREYASFSEKNKIEKILSVLRHGFYKNTLERNLGQFLAI